MEAERQSAREALEAESDRISACASRSAREAVCGQSGRGSFAALDALAPSSPLATAVVQETEWQPVTTPDGLTYFWNTRTRETTWRSPFAADGDDDDDNGGGDDSEPGSGGGNAPGGSGNAGSTGCAHGSRTQRAAHSYTGGVGSVHARYSEASHLLDAAVCGDDEPTASGGGGNGSGGGGGGGGGNGRNDGLHEESSSGVAGMSYSGAKRDVASLVFKK